MYLKKHLLGGILMVSCGILSLSSCSNDEDIIESLTNKTELDNQPDVVVSSTKYWMASENNSKLGVMPIDEPILQFKDEAAYNRITEELKGKTAEERVAYFEKLGFNGAYRQLMQADDELEQIFENVDDSIQFIKEITKFKSKYGSKFFFDENDTLNATPYLNFNDEKLSLVGNILGMAVVGNEIIRPSNSSPALAPHLNEGTFVSAKKNNRFTLIYKKKKHTKRYSTMTFGHIAESGTLAVYLTSQWKKFFVTKDVYKNISYKAHVKINDGGWIFVMKHADSRRTFDLCLPAINYHPSFKAEIKDFESSYCPYPKSTTLNNIVLRY